MTQSVLIVAAHPDDEVLGMGGTMARHSAQGDRVSILFLGNGVGARDGVDTEEINRRQKAANHAAKIVGAQIVAFHDFPDNQFDSVPLFDLVQAVEAAKSKVQPDLVYTHHGGDLNVDHRLSCQAVLTAFRPQPGEKCREILSFEVNSATEWSAPSVTSVFVPNTYVDVSAFLAKLESACQAYEEEMREAPHTRSVDAVMNAARKRGSEVGLMGAEAFMSLRRIIP